MATKSIGQGYYVDEDGKLQHKTSYRDASHGIRMRKSKKQRPISRAKATLARCTKP